MSINAYSSGIMQNPSTAYLLTLVPDLDHPELNAMRNFLGSKKIDIPVRLYHQGQQAYAAEVRMIGHSHALYKAALDAVLDSLAARKPALQWDHVRFHSENDVRKEDMLQASVSISDFISIYRRAGFAAAQADVHRHLQDISQEADHAKARRMLELNIMRLCASIISTSIEVTPDPAYAPAPRKSLLQRLLPRR